MRSLQLLGFILTLVAVGLGYIMLAPLDSAASEAAAGASGLAIIFAVLPLFGWAALMLVPTTIALFNAEVRSKTFFVGKFWLTLWRLNILLSSFYIVAAVSVLILWLNYSVAG